MRLDSEKVVIQSPTSFTGSARRIWKITDQANPVAKWLMVAVAVVLVFAAWVFVAAYTVVFGVLLVPWRLLRRGSRKRRRDEMRHREILER